MELRQEVLGLLERCVSLRRRLHQIPETGYEEIDTQRFVLERLEACRPDRLETLAGTGVRAAFFAPEAKGDHRLPGGHGRAEHHRGE